MVKSVKEMHPSTHCYYEVLCLKLLFQLCNLFPIFCSTGIFTIRFPKETPGEKFDGLDMLTQLMAPTGSDSASEPFIEPLGKCKRSFLAYMIQI